MWNIEEKFLGDVKQDKEVSFTFIYEGDKKIISASPDCGCSPVDISDKSVTIKYVTPSLPPSLSEMNFRKGVKVTLSDNTSYHLYISGVIKLDKYFV